MRIDREAGAGGPIVTGFTEGGFKVGEAIHHALMITPEAATDWTPPPLAALAVADLDAILNRDPAPEFLLLGTGADLVRPAPALIAAIEARGIGVEAMSSRAAARTWGVLRAEGREIVGAFYPL
ncbi:MTH938/NDUFAF3 family protein [Hephaestia sp. GCM10023244]|uniref:Mth938-like domain-containing protein n=1 Tax=unclassified Hephaestia TaxID=2631281 RepID=UPI002076D594|nr:Mth938-like domain-containing protein [Hephaestia sp. MAHUQ-44]MCM8730463.1 Mth938-like domain-containing protein [Hephaestia sp. MAHUQ-44]